MLIELKELRKYVKNKDLLRVVEHMLTKEEVFCINTLHYKDAPFSERVYIDKYLVPDIDKYNIINVANAFQTNLTKAEGIATIEKHSLDVLEETACFIDSCPNLLDMYCLDRYKELWKREQARQAILDIIYVGAYLHDIGKALLELNTPNIFNHTFIGGEYLYKYKREIVNCFNEGIGELMYKKLEDIIRWHMSLILSKYNKEVIIDRKPKHQKHFETYLISLMDWKVNTKNNKYKEKEYNSILNNINSLQEALQTEGYEQYTKKGTLCVKINNFNLILI